MTLDVSPFVTKNIFRNVVCLVEVGTIVAKGRHCVGSQSSGITFDVRGVDQQLQHQEVVMFGGFGIFLTYHPIVCLWTLSVTTGQVCRNFRRFGKTAKSELYLSHVCPSVRPRGTARLPLYRLSSNFIFEYFSKIYREDSSFIKI